MRRALRTALLTLAAGAALAGPEAPTPSFTPEDRVRFQEAAAKLGELTDRPGLSLEDTLGDALEKVPMIRDPKVPALLRECLDRPFRAPDHADRIAAALLAQAPAEERLAFAASLLEIAPSPTSEAKAAPEDLTALEGLGALKDPLAAFLDAAAAARAAWGASCPELLPEEMRILVRTLLETAAKPFLEDPALAGRLGLAPGKAPEASPLAAMAKLQRPAQLRAALAFTVAARALAEAVAALPPEALDAVVAPDARREIPTGLGLLVIGGRGPTRHPPPAAPVLMALDLGGHDAWEGAWASADGPGGAPLACLLDLSGDDVYLANDSLALGCGYFGVGLLIDLAGDDRYAVRHFGLGCGLGGIGILHDLRGHDVYEGDTHVQGAGIFGLGLLLDDAGTDRYQAALDSQAFSFVLGVGILADGGGDDRYLAGGRYRDDLNEEEEDLGRTKSRSQGFAWGWRPLAPGGAACLLDAGGDDVYDTAQGGMAQGTGYWFGYGLLYDGGGDDVYDANYYAQAVGLHFGTGVLIDRGGDDAYKLTGGGGQCWSHDFSTAFLIDRAGNDRYTVSRTPASRGFQVGCGQGGGNIRGIGLFLDAGGDDRYDLGPDWTPEAKLRMVQMQEYKKRHPDLSDEEILKRRRGMGILLDAGGKDAYAPAGKDASDWLRMLSCLARDL